MGYSPEQGDIVWLNFDPQLGREQAKRRPALVVSPRDYNTKVGLAIFSITSKVKGYPFEVRLPEDLDISGVVLVDQIKSLDWRARQVTFICQTPRSLVIEVSAKLKALLPPT